jgi:hypothetical protein
MSKSGARKRIPAWRNPAIFLISNENIRGVNRMFISVNARLRHVPGQ